MAKYTAAMRDHMEGTESTWRGRRGGGAVSRFWDETRTISTDTCLMLLDEVQRRTELLMRATGAPESEKRRIQEEIMRAAVTRCGGRGSRMSSIPAGRAQEALRIIREWQGDAFDLLEGAT